MATAEDIPRERMVTGVPGLDDVLDGGLLRRAIYLVRGRPGCGKTILASQICFHHAREGGRVLYVTLLAESHERMIFNVEQLSFFDATLIPRHISYVSGIAALEADGVKGLVTLLRQEAERTHATLLVLDGLVAADAGVSPRDAKTLVRDLQVFANMLDCTVLVLNSETGTDVIGPEHTMVDGVIALSDAHVGLRAQRELEVKKFRGSGYLRGSHAFQIDKSGIALFPRIEARFGYPPPRDAHDKRARIASGVDGLDAALGGGFPAVSSTALFGPTGTGKTSLGLHFLDAGSFDEGGVLFGFYETPERLLMKSDGFGLRLSERVAENKLRIVWNPPTERDIDALAYKLLNTVDELGARRVFVDGVDGFMKQATHPDRISSFFTAIVHQLRLRGATVLFTVELQDLFGSKVGLPLQGISSLVENMLLMRFVLEREMVRTLCVVKARDTVHDPRLHQLLISSNGLSLGAPVEGPPGRETRVARKRTSGTQKQRRRKPQRRRP